MKTITISLVAISVLFGNTFAMAEQLTPVTGSACYHYGDNETTLAAKKMATDLAKRNALENYITYVASTTQVENFILKKDSIISAASGYLYDMKVTRDQNKDREYCVSITANVKPDEVRNLLTAQLSDIKKEDETIEKAKDLGEIDWRKRVIRVTGFGAANKLFPKHVWKKDAEDNALLDAQTKILEILKGVDLESKKYIENYQTREQSIRKSVQGSVKKSYQIGKTKFSPEEDTAQVVVEAKIPEE